MTEYETFFLIGAIIGVYITNTMLVFSTEDMPIPSSLFIGLLICGIQFCIGIGVFVILLALNWIFDAI